MFLLFYLILIVLFSMIFAVLGVGNKKFGKFGEAFGGVVDIYEDDGIPDEEYKHIGLFFGYIFSTLRQSLGDFDFSASTYLAPQENITYWIVWFLVVLMTCIVFLNFIIAEAANSYTNVKNRLEAMVHKEKASLISEAEDITWDYFKDEKKLPQYIVIRSIEI
jgi:hypothetical protein